MKNTKMMNGDIREAFLKCFAVIMGVLMLAFLPGFISRAETPGTISAASANIRQTADGSSAVIGSVKQGDTVSITSEVADSGGTVWYEVFVDSNTKGFIRSDLVKKNDGSGASANLQPVTTPPATTTPQTPAVTETPAAVTAVQPQGGTVKGSDTVRVRSNASTTSAVVTTAKSGVALTVTGTAAGSDGKTWYQVNFINEGSEVTGFIREDYVELDGELVPADQAPAEGGEGGTDAPEDTQPTPEETPQESKDMDTRLQDGEWYLIDNAKDKQYNIEDLFSAVEKNAQLYKDSAATVKNQKIIVIVLVIVVVVLALGVTLLIFKIKDMMDSAYFEEVEKDTIRSRNPDRKVMQTVGKEGSGKSGSRPTGTRPASQGSASASQQGRAGAKPAAGRQTTQEGRGTGSRQTVSPENRTAKPASQGSRATAGGRPTIAPEGRPTGSRAASPEGRPTGSRPVSPEGRPAGSKTPGSRPAARQNKSGAPNPGWKSKNFMTDDDDEFEFEFLNWDGDDDQ